MHVLHPPALAEVLLLAGAVQGTGERLAIDEHHVVALAPPAAGVVVHAQVAAEVGALASGVQDHVVVVAAEVGAFLAVRFERRRRARHLAAPARVEVEQVRRQALPTLVVDVPERAQGQLTFVAQYDSCPLQERHPEPGDERASCVARVCADLDQGAAEAAHRAVPDREEIADRHVHARKIGAVPVDAQHGLAQQQRVGDLQVMFA